MLFDNLKEYIFVIVNFKDESSNYLTKNLKRVNLQKVGPVSVLYSTSTLKTYNRTCKCKERGKGKCRHPYWLSHICGTVS